MKLGGEPKKVIILGGLVAVAAVVFITENFSGSSEEPAPRRAAAAQVVNPSVNETSVNGGSPAAGGAIERRSDGGRRRTGSNSLGEFKPVERSANPKDRPDPSTIDPEIRFDVLAKLEQVQVDSTGRNIFQMGPPPEAAASKKAGPDLPKTTPPIDVTHAAATGPSTPPPQPAPPITFKYYGFEVSKASGRKEAFLLDGEDIMIAGENDTVKRGRYKITHIGVNSITIEDTQFKHSQTLQLEELTGGAA